MRNWKFRHVEKNTKESHSYIFNSLEMKNYIQKFLFSKYGFSLNNYRINFFNSTVEIFISIYKIKRLKYRNALYKVTTNNCKQVEKKLLDELTLEIKSVLKPYLFIEIEKIKKSKTKNYNSTNLSALQKEKMLKLNYQNLKILIAKLNKKQKTNILHIRILKLILKFHSKNLMENIMESLTESIKLFLKNKFNIKLTILNLENNLNYEYKKEIPIKASKNKKFKNTNIKEILELKLRRFEKTTFFDEGTKILFFFSSNANSQKLLTDFIAKELKNTKQHKLFLNFLKEGLNVTINYLLINNKNYSKISGIKLIIKGRLNNVMRASSYTLKIGTISLIEPKPNLSYTENTSYEKNGTLGIKLWTLHRKETF